MTDLSAIRREAAETLEKATVNGWIYPPIERSHLRALLDALDAADAERRAMREALEEIVALRDGPELRAALCDPFQSAVNIARAALGGTT